MYRHEGLTSHFGPFRGKFLSLHPTQAVVGSQKKGMWSVRKVYGFC